MEEEIKKTQEILSNLLIIQNVNSKGKTKYRPIKNTSRQDCYKALREINELVGKYKWW